LETKGILTSKRLTIGSINAIIKGVRFDGISENPSGFTSRSYPEKKQMNISKFFAVGLVTVMTVILVGCGSTPKVLRAQVVVPPVYTYGQEPEKVTIADSGRQYRSHLKALQEQRLAHERAMKEMEYRAEEARYAKEKGLAAPQGPLPQAFAPPPGPPPGYYASPPPMYYAGPPPIRHPRHRTVPYYPAVYGGGHYEIRRLGGTSYPALVR
jgi:hypothetical protein